MPALVPVEPVDYLVIGHLVCDLTPEGPRLGGTAAYSALTAQALGLRVGMVTAWGGEFPLDPLKGILIHAIAAEHSTSFENEYTSLGRIQHIHTIAPDLTFNDIPEPWQRTPIIHIGPVVGEAKAIVNGKLSSTLLGLTPQGWLRAWDDTGKVRHTAWPEANKVLNQVGAVVISVEDVNGDEEMIEAMAASCHVLAVTEGAAGTRLYWNGDLRRFFATSQDELDATGAGDIFAAAFFWRLYSTRDPWAAARFATNIASLSVKRRGLEGIPTQEEIQSCLVEVL